MKIWNIAIKQPIFMSMILLAGIILGTISFLRMPVSLFPDVEFPVLLVTTVYPGASPEEVEEQVTEVLEEELGTATGLDTIDSYSSEGISTIVLQFKLDMTLDEIRQDVREKVSGIRNDLPTGTQDPVIQSFNPDNLPILTFSVADKTGMLSLSELRTLVDEEIKGPLERVPSEVDVSGGEIREIQVNLDTQALQAYRISPQQVTRAIQEANINLPGGTVANSEQEVLIRTPANLQTLQDIENLVISQRGAAIHLADIATVVDGYEKRDAITRLNGQDAIVVSVRKQSGSNTVEIAEKAKAELEVIEADHPNLNVVITSDQSLLVERATDGAVEDLLYAAALAALVMLFFFRDLRNTFVTVAGLPVILIATIFFMDLAGISLNQISLLALALVVGLVIDDGIVVRENILRWVEKGYSPRVAASMGTKEVVLPVLATSATILSVFLPVAYAQGIIGKFFLDFGLTVSIAIAVSTFEALTMAPMLSAYFFKAKEGAMDVELSELDDLEIEDVPEDDHDTHSTGWLNRLYGSFLDWTLRHKALAIVITTIIVLSSFASVALVEVTFLPYSDRDEFSVSMALPGGTPMSITEQEAMQVQEIIRSHPTVTDVVTRIGGQGTPEEASFTAVLDKERPSDVTAKSVMNDLRQPLANVPNLVFSLDSGGPQGVTTDITVEIAGGDGVSYAMLGEQALLLVERLQAMDGVVDIDSSYKPGRPEMQLDVDRERLADLGLSTAQVASTVRLLVNGDVATTFRGEGTEADIRVQLAEGDRSTSEDILGINLLSATGQLIPLRNVASAIMAVGPNQISRSDQQNVLTVNANVVGRTAPSAVEEVGALIDGLTLPEGVEMKLGGTVEDQQEAFTSLILAMLLGVVFIYMVLASQFGSLIQPLLIMLALPLAIVGAILALLVSGKALDMTALIGFIMLMGLATKNSILLVDFANREHQRGKSADDAMRVAGPVRLRPILMTSLSMILAMIPIALGVSAGGEFRQPMAIAILGGMVTSTLLTLIVVPLGYGTVIGALDYLSARRRRRQASQKDFTAQQGMAENAVSPDAMQPVGD